MLSTLALEYSFRKGLKPDAVSDIQILLEEEHGNTEKKHGQGRGTYAKQRHRSEVIF